MTRSNWESRDNDPPRPVESRIKSASTTRVRTRPAPACSHAASVAFKYGATEGSRSIETRSIDTAGRSSRILPINAAERTPDPAPGSRTRNVPFSGRRGIEAMRRAAAAGVKNCPSSACVRASRPPRAATRSTSATPRRSVAITPTWYLDPPTSKWARAGAFQFPTSQ